MQKILVIHGPMGSGKSTISAKLNEILTGYVLVDRAYIKDTMLKHVKKEKRDLAKRLSKEAVLLISKGLIEEGYNLILQEFRASSVKKWFGEGTRLSLSILTVYWKHRNDESGLAKMMRANLNLLKNCMRNTHTLTRITSL